MKRLRRPCVYIMTNRRNTVLYTGVTSDLVERVSKHKTGITRGFVTKYRVTKLVYSEDFERMDLAIEREKQIKGGTRQDKVDPINSINPEWKDLFEEYLF